MLSSLARGGQGMAARVAQRSATAASSAAARAASTPAAAARRSMGGHARNIGLPGEHVPIEVSKVHQTLGTVYLTTMFLWMMYRAKQDGLVLLVSFSFSPTAVFMESFCHPFPLGHPLGVSLRPFVRACVSVCMRQI